MQRRKVYRPTRRADDDDGKSVFDADERPAAAEDADAEVERCVCVSEARVCVCVCVQRSV
jgi:hypothetical protein